MLSSRAKHNNPERRHLMAQGKGKRLTKEEKDQAWSWYFTNKISTEEIGKRLGVTGVAIRSMIKKRGGVIRSARECHVIYNCNESAFEKMTNEGAYFIGFLMADGAILDKDTDSSPKLEVTLHQQDVDILEKMKAFLGSEHPIAKNETKNTCRLSIRSAELVEDLSHWGVVPRKTQTAAAHPDLVHNPHFWRGVVDGDGHIDKGNSCPLISLIGSFQLMGQFKDFADPIIAPMTVEVKPSNKGGYNGVVSLNGHAAKAMIEALYLTEGPSSDRKSKKAVGLYEQYKNHKFRVLSKERSFPWSYTDQHKAESDFNKLKEMDASLLICKKGKHPNSIIHGAVRKSRIGYYAAGFHNERKRLKARAKGGKSPSEAWKDKELKAKIIKEAENRKHSSLRASLMANTRPAYCFPPAVAKGVYQMVDAKNVFDPCCGWGDRLVAALANDCNYRGCDPNSDMSTVYSQIHGHYGYTNECSIQTVGVEYCEVEPEWADIVFTSPPYFDWEEYSQDQCQSHIKYKTSEEWRSGFLKSMISKSHTVLKNGSMMAINISEVPGKERGSYIPLVDWLHEDATSTGFTYMGSLLLPTGNMNKADELIYFFRK